ncbi:MAG: FHA domain-containing protein [Myxococcota bacterium]
MNEVVLEVLEGADAGRRFVIPVGTYRVIGRAYGASGGTTIVSRGEHRRLDSEDQRRVGEHLAYRRGDRDQLGARGRMEHFVREGDIDLDDDAVSQTHALLLVDEAGTSLLDIASTNGTYVNGQRVTESTLVPGDLVRIGGTRLALVGG